MSERKPLSVLNRLSVIEERLDLMEIEIYGKCQDVPFRGVSLKKVNPRTLSSQSTGFSSSSDEDKSFGDSSSCSSSSIICNYNP